MKQNLNKTRKDETGKTYGDWTVLGVSSKKTKEQTIYWVCKCECGKTKDVKGTSLRDGSSTGCGCTRSLRLPQTPESLYRKYYRAYKYGCKRKTKTIDFDISYEFYRSLVEKDCYFCGKAPYDIRYLYNRKRTRSILEDVSCCITGIDRLDNDLGYTEENCVPCCKMCNLMKLDSTEVNFLTQIKLIYENRRDEIEKIGKYM